MNHLADTLGESVLKCWAECGAKQSSAANNIVISSIWIVGLVRTGGLEPPQTFVLRIFIPATAFAAAIFGVCGLDYPFTLARLERRHHTSNSTREALGAARLVSTPSLSGLARDRHVKGFPEFEQFYFPGFPGSTQFFKSVASTGFATSAMSSTREAKPLSS